MTDLEDRIRDALHDPRWELPAWPDPMPRVRRAAARQRARLATATVVLLAAVVTPLALLPGLAAHAPRVKPSAGGTRPNPSSRSSAPAVPHWAARLHGEVAYKCGDYICLMRPDGSGKRTLTATFPEWDPAWSPDGRRLAFRGYYGPDKGDNSLYMVGANGCHLTKLDAAMNGTRPAWSPSGRQIAFSGVGGIAVVNADGTGFRQLTRDRYGDDFPSWSVRNQIAFVRYGPKMRYGEIYVMNADGSGLAPLTHGGAGYGQPSWSPDGQPLAFVADSAGSLWSSGVIDVANADGTGVHPVSPSSWSSNSPTWTPGGKIVFLVIKGFQASPLGGEQPRVSAYIVNRDGTGLRLLYPSLGDALQIAWGSAPLPSVGCPQNLTPNLGG